MIRGNLIASIAVFTNLYDAEHDIYYIFGFSPVRNGNYQSKKYVVVRYNDAS